MGQRGRYKQKNWFSEPETYIEHIRTVFLNFLSTFKPKVELVFENKYLSLLFIQYAEDCVSFICKMFRLLTFVL